MTWCREIPSRSTTRERRALLAVCCGLLIGGCQTPPVTPERPIPDVVSRFGLPADSPGLVHIGLNVQSQPEFGQQRLAMQLGTLVAAEIELTGSGARVVPWTPEGPLSARLIPGTRPLPDSPGAPVPDIPAEADVINVSFQAPQSVVPPTFPAETIPPLPIEVDQVLQIQVLEIRPWYPMRAVVHLTVLSPDTREPRAATTAEWTVADGRICGGCVPPHQAPTLSDLCHDEVNCSPSADHNSPEAFMKVMSREIAAWYHATSPSAAAAPTF